MLHWGALPPRDLSSVAPHWAVFFSFLFEKIPFFFILLVAFLSSQIQFCLFDFIALQIFLQCSFWCIISLPLLWAPLLLATVRGASMPAIGRPVVAFMVAIRASLLDLPWRTDFWVLPSFAMTEATSMLAIGPSVVAWLVVIGASMLDLPWRTDFWLPPSLVMTEATSMLAIGGPVAASLV
jgi:hypothetical protein